MDPHPELMTTAQAADLLHLKPQTLRKWRVTGAGPRYIRLGAPGRGRVVYAVRDIQLWLAARAHRSTSEETVARAKASSGRK